MNNLSDEISRDYVKETVHAIKEKLKECVSGNQFYNYEGKSGYIKIFKTIKDDLNISCYLDFGLTSNEENYYVLLRLQDSVLAE